MSGRVRSLAVPAAATLIGLAVLVGLGVWQLKRLAWKEALIAAVEARALAPPVEIPSAEQWAKLNPRDYEYRHVRVSGVYDYARQAMVFRALASPRGRYGGPGYLVMTPLELADGASVLVDPISLEMIKGSELDFVDDLMGQTFMVRNPNAVASCGCGVSFSI